MTIAVDLGLKATKQTKLEPLNPHADASSGAWDIKCGLSLLLHPYFVYDSREGYGESAFCADLSEPSLLDNVVSTKISCAGPD